MAALIYTQLNSNLNLITPKYHTILQQGTYQVGQEYDGLVNPNEFINFFLDFDWIASPIYMPTWYDDRYNYIFFSKISFSTEYKLFALITIRVLIDRISNKIKIKEVFSTQLGDDGNKTIVSWPEVAGFALYGVQKKVSL